MAELCRDYWETYYQGGVAPEEPSLFAQYVADTHLNAGARLIELGCGNGRDARFFAGIGLGVTAIDQCVREVSELDKAKDEGVDLTFEADDFTNLPDYSAGFDAVYSRFTLHSVTTSDQSRTLNWASRNLNEGGRLCIETRGTKNELFRKGTPVEGEPAAFIHDKHFRRFVDFGEFTEEVTATGLVIVEAAEETGFAPFEDTDYHFIRVIAEKS